VAKVRRRKYEAGWRYMLDFYDHEGKRQRETLPDGTTLKAANLRLKEIQETIGRGQYIPENKQPPFHQVAAQWLEYKKGKVRSTTWEVYEGHTRNHFDDFRRIKINRVSIAKVESWIAKRQKQGMPLSTIRKILVTMGQIFKYAIRHSYISFNPLAAAERPKAVEEIDADNDSDDLQSKIKVLQPEEIQRLIAAVDHIDDSWRKENRLRVADKLKIKTMFKLAIMSGTRQGELLGLQWQDVDWVNSQLEIRRTFNNNRWFPPKTKQSRRDIDLAKGMITDLKRWKVACPKTELNLMFPNRAGNPISHMNLYKRYFKPALAIAGLDPSFRWHDMRHTYASLLLAQGENVKYIQKQLGHSNPTVTLNVYAHLMKKKNQTAANRLEHTIFGL